VSTIPFIVNRHLDDDELRDSFCTPKEYADAYGACDLDPFSNPRSHIKAARAFDVDRGQDGFALARYVPRSWRVWCNPPYSRGNVERAVAAYRHTRYTFLLRHDPSTAWFAELWSASDLVCNARDRIDFEPPPGVEASNNPFPAVFFVRHEDDLTPELAALCYVMRPRR
jgi:DNA N-6-adenine-methyltransferase (Dam)